MLCLQTEVKMLRELNHANIVKLIGFCRECNHRMLVYEYMDKGSLDNSLFTGKTSQENLRRWSLRKSKFRKNNESGLSMKQQTEKG